jgi:hypothetical protein
VGREGREEVPVHVAQTGPFSTGKGILREEVTIHVVHMGTLPLEGEKGENYVMRCRPPLHRRAHSRHGGGGKQRGAAGPRCTYGPFLDRKGGCRRR